MPVVRRSAFVSYSSKQMFDLVVDVERYPEFLPWCEDVKVEEETEMGLTAALAVNFQGIKLAFTTKNTHILHQKVMMQLVRGPFRHLHGHWEFIANAHGCETRLVLQFTFRSKLLELTIGKVFEYMVGNMVQAFTQRAYECYVR